jgi:ribosome-interacting GTPase 1
MPTIEEQIKALEDEIRRTPYNKATEKHISRLRGRVAKLKEKQEKASARNGGRRISFKKSGDATVSIIGVPNVGKSTLLNKLTSAKSDIGDYQFTTLEFIPGMMDYKGASIQLVDLPGLIKDAAKGRGRGREVLSIARASDLIVVMLDPDNKELDAILKELHEAHVRLDEHPPNISISRRESGGITLSSTRRLKDREGLIEILREWGCINADVAAKENLTPERLIDFLAGNRVYIPSLKVINKADLLHDNENKSFRKRFQDAIFISAREGVGLDRLRESIFEKLRLIRIYLRPQGGNPDYEKPLILREGATVDNVCSMIHRAFEEKFRYAQVWGKSAKFEGQKVGLEHKVEDEDVVTIVIKR